MYTPQSRSRRLTLLCIGTGTLLLAGIVTGCGGSTASTSTRDEFVKQANAICSAGSARIATAAKALPPGGPPTGAAAQTFFDTIMTEGKSQADALRALTPPADLQTDFTAFVDQFQKTNDALKAQGAQAFFASQDDPYKALGAMAVKMGLTACTTNQ
jgi:hypothetical protein